MFLLPVSSHPRPQASLLRWGCHREPAGARNPEGAEGLSSAVPRERDKAPVMFPSLSSCRLAPVSAAVTGRLWQGGTNKVPACTRELGVTMEMAERGVQESNQIKMSMDSWAPSQLCVQGSDPRQLSKDIEGRATAQTAARAPLSGTHTAQSLREPHGTRRGFVHRTQMGTTAQRRWLELAA